VFAGPVFVQQLGDQIPAIYPASDLFLAPFLAHVAATIDETLHQHNLADNDRIFLATFSAVTGAGLLLSGCLCVVAARVKLANLGAFLPYSVLCGFFTAIGILMWTLGFSVDTGYKVGEVVRSGDIHVMLHALVHHAPSVVIGVVMHVLGPKNPFWVMILVGWTVGGVYLIMWLTGTTLQQAQEWNWFFPASDLVVSRDYSGSGYGPPLPFGVLMSLVRGEVFWEAFRASVPTVLALAFLYVIRCSLHSAALKKNIPNVTRKRPDVPPLLPNTNTKKKKSTIAPVATTFRQPPLTLGYILEHG
jgi:MFS superfamily sulfate permease-like transporter